MEKDGQDGLMVSQMNDLETIKIMNDNVTRILAILEKLIERVKYIESRCEVIEKQTQYLEARINLHGKTLKRICREPLK